jgi:acetyl esterase/lipase
VKIPRVLRVLFATVLGLVLLAFVAVGTVWVYFHPRIDRTDGIVYGQRQNQSLTLDIIRPPRPNGIGVVLIASGGWHSKAGSFKTWIAAPLLRRGYTVFAVYHISQPEVTIMEIVKDVDRAVRFIRLHAAEYRIDPNRLGVTGGSSGGHLSLMLATRGGPGKSDAPDPVDRQSSAVQAVAVFYPPTDLLNLGTSTENPGDGGPPKSFVRGFGPQSTNPAVWKVIGREMSPIYHVHSNQPPILIYHGDADTLVPLDQSERFQARARELGPTVNVVVHKGGKHGWPSMIWDIRSFGKWFDRHLRQAEPKLDVPPPQT